MVRIERIESFSDIDRNDWNALLQDSDNTYIFQTYEFQNTWWKHFGGKNNRRELLLLLAIDKDTIIGIAPLMMEKIPFFGKSIIRFIGSPICDYMDFIVSKNRESEVIRYLFSYIKQLNCIEIDLAYIPEGSPSLISEKIKFTPTDKCPYINLAEDWDTTYNQLNQTIKRYVSRRQRVIERLGGKLEFGYVKYSHEIDGFLEGYFKMHVKRWRELGRKYSQFQYSSWKNFVREISHILFPMAYIDLSYLKLNSVIIACHFGFIYNRVFHWYMPSFNPDYSRFSPGNLFIMHLLRHLSDNGLVRFDFLRGEEKYKTMWTNTSKSLFRYLDYSEYFFLKNTGRFIRIIKDFYVKRVKNRIKQITPMMKVWYRIKQRDD